MRELQRETIGDRRVGLVAQYGDYYAVSIEVRGPAGWEDISLRADQYLAFDVASRRYCLRVAEQDAGDCVGESLTPAALPSAAACRDGRDRRSAGRV